MRSSSYSILVAAVTLSVVCIATRACECGIEGSANRIYQGSNVEGNKYPWIAHIRSYKDRSAGSFGQCGGSLVDEQHVLTAAHCVFAEGATMDPSSIDVFLGRTKAFSESSEHESVSDVWTDPNFDDQTLAHDFAILTLSEPVKITMTVAPICLPNSEDGLTKLKVSGWGITSFGASQSSDDLLEVDVDYLTHDECNALQKSYLLEKNGMSEDMAHLVEVGSVPETHMCAINMETKGDACQGDSGGPLMHRGSNGRYYLMAVVSGSWTECGQNSKSAGLYTRTFYYMDTIKSIATNACWQDL